MPNHDPRIVPDVRDPVDVECGAAHACVRTTTGEVRCWGANERAQVTGLPGSADTMWVTRIAVGDTPVSIRTLALGAQHTCATGDSDTFCWGSNQEDQISTSGSAPNIYNVPTRVGDGARPMAAWLHHTCFVFDSSFTCTGRPPSIRRPIPVDLFL